MKLETAKLVECGENGASGTTLPTAAKVFCAEKDWSRRCFYDRLCLDGKGKEWYHIAHAGVVEW